MRNRCVRRTPAPGKAVYAYGGTHNRAMGDTLRIGLFIFDGAEELDWVGPWEVLATWSLGWPDDGVETFTVARAEGSITCAKGLCALPDHTWETAPPIDVLIYPGGRGTRDHLGDEAIHA